MARAVGIRRVPVPDAANRFAAGDISPIPTVTPVSPSGLAAALALVLLGLAAALWWRYRSRTGEGSSDRTAAPTDEERVLSILAAHDGRTRQSVIVEETGWSKSKVSMLLSEMAEKDEIRKIRVGRENLISLPGQEPDAVRSPLDDAG